MSIKITLATAALALAMSASFGSSPGFSPTPATGTWQQYRRAKVQCYYLPTVSNGRVTGLQRHQKRRLGPRRPLPAATTSPDPADKFQSSPTGK